MEKGYNTEALEVLVDVIEPLKIYERNAGDTLYTVFSPYTKIADVATPDQKVAREFRKMVSTYVTTRDEKLGKDIIAYLQRWQNNHKAFQELVKQSPVLEEALGLSENLAAIAGFGLEAIRFSKSKKRPTTHWRSAAKEALIKAREQGGRCELQVVSAIELLVMSVK